MASLQCDTNYASNPGDPTTVKCTPTGWTSNFKTCTPTCPISIIPQVAHGKVSAANVIFQGDSLTLVCDPGYAIEKGGTVTIQCLSTHIFSKASFGNCVPICPTTMAQVSNGVITYPADTPYIGTTATVTCNSGFGLGNLAVASTTCSAAGQGASWSPATLGPCVVECPNNMAPVTNGKITYPNPGFVGTMAQMTCNSPNYAPSAGTSTVTIATCTDKGTWSPPSFGQCAVVCLETLGEVQHGVIVYPSPAFAKTTAQLLCDPDYQIITANGVSAAVSQVTCNPDGTWSGTLGTCIHLDDPTDCDKTGQDITA